MVRWTNYVSLYQLYKSWYRNEAFIFVQNSLFVIGEYYTPVLGLGPAQLLDTHLHRKQICLFPCKSLHKYYIQACNSCQKHYPRASLIPVIGSLVIHEVLRDYKPKGRGAMRIHVSVATGSIKSQINLRTADGQGGTFKLH